MAIRGRRWRQDFLDLRRYLLAAYIDLRLAVTGKAERDLPPLRLRDVGAGDFREIGDLLVQMLVQHGLRPTDRVLDIGSGVGRVAIPLTRYLTGGTYEGFDVVQRWVRWCRRHITPASPQFRFKHCAVFNSHYNRRGTSAETFRFPYPDSSFDFAFATSVFTHLHRDGAQNYLREIGRVLRPGGRFAGTFFIVTTDAPANTALDFAVDRGEYRLLDANDPDAAVAFREDWLREQLSGSEWRNHVIVPGSWRAAGGAMFQDVVVADRR